MRKIFWSAFLFMILIMAGCATTEPQVVETAPEQKAEEPEEEPVKEPVFIDVYKPVSETLTSSDGVVDGYVEYDYDDEGNLLEKRELDSDRKLLTRMENTVSGNNIARTQYYRGEENEPGIYKVYNYQGGNLVEEISYDQKDVPQTISTYEYDGMGNVVKWTVSSGDNVPMMVTEYEYEGDRRTKALFLTPLGEPEGHIEYIWDMGHMVEEKTYDDKEKLETAVEYVYDGDNLVGETHYRKTVVNYTIEYELDEAGNALLKRHFYRSGNLKAQWDYEYVSFKKEVLE
jgi:hypothetical protein